MNFIKQYHQLIDVKPPYYQLAMPHQQASQKRFIFNVEEFELWYNEEINAYQDHLVQSKKRGSDESSIQKEPKNQKIICILLD
jgi:hypothetical protein